MGTNINPWRQTTSSKAHSQLHTEERYLNFLVKTHLRVKKFPTPSTQEATPDGSEPARTLHPGQAGLPPSVQTESARSDDCQLWGDQLGWPANEPAGKPWCPHKSLSRSPWSLGSNLLSRGTQTLSPSPEAHGLDNKTVNSSPRAYRRCSPRVQVRGHQIHCTAKGDPVLLESKAEKECSQLSFFFF